MNIYLISILLFLVSFSLAIWSMRDFSIPTEISKLLKIKRLKGTIVFFRDKIEHYSSSSSSSSI